MGTVAHTKLRYPEEPSMTYSVKLFFKTSQEFSSHKVQCLKAFGLLYEGVEGDLTDTVHAFLAHVLIRNRLCAGIE